MGWSASRLVSGKNEPLTIAPKPLLNLFSVAADYILVVPDYLFETVICHLKAQRYAYKVANYRNNHVIAIQYDKIRG
jgi:hypothetical protein